MKTGFRIVLGACLALSACGPAVVPRRSVRVSAPAAKLAAPVLKRLENGGYYVRKPWTVELDGHRWTIPRGYHTNGLTAPDRIKRSLGDGVDFPETWAAVFHDWLFKQEGVTRKQADQWFYDFLIEYGVPRAKARLMFATVSAYSMSKKFR